MSYQDGQFCIAIPNEPPAGVYGLAVRGVYSGATWTFDQTSLTRIENVTLEQAERQDIELQLRMFEQSVSFLIIVAVVFTIGVVLGWIMRGRTDAREHC